MQLYQSPEMALILRLSQSHTPTIDAIFVCEQLMLVVLLAESHLLQDLESS